MAVTRKPSKKRSIANESQASLAKLGQDSESTLDDANTSLDKNEDGSVTVNFLDKEEDETTDPYDNLGFYQNLVDVLEDDQLNKLADMVMSNYNADEDARSDWMKTLELGFDLLGVKVQENNAPFEGACSAQHPLLLESAVKFQSKASNELLPAAGPVKTVILGDTTEEKEDQAYRVKAHMNYQITEEMTEFYTDSERMLLYVPLVGSGFKKTYYNMHLERPCSEFVPSDQFVVPNSASDLHRADRYTHILYKTDYELEADCECGLYCLPEDGLGEPSEAKITIVQKKANELIGAEISLGSRDKVYTLYEQHVMVYIEDLDEREPSANGKKYKLASPYIITVDSNSQKVIGLRRNWKEGDSKRKKKVPFTHYSFVPSFNFYSYGFIHLLGNLQLSLTAALRSLVDAGQFATLQGGFKLKGVRMVDDGTPIHPGQFKEIESTVQDITKAIMPLPFKEPSATLYNMLNFLDTKGQSFADSTENVIQDSTNYGPVGTTMALLEASAKFFSAIHKRLHASLKNELRLIAEINSETLEDDTEYNLDNETMKISATDYDMVGVIPVSDPNNPSSAQRLAKANSVYQMAIQSPQYHNMPEVLKQVYANMEFVNVQKILTQPQEAQPQDPMTDIQLASQGQPIKAFPGQDHQTHIMIKQAFLQDPNSGANPMMGPAIQSIKANIQEHMLLGFTEQVQAQMSMAQSQSQQPIDPAQIMGIAAQQVAKMNQTKMQQDIDNAQKDPKDQAAVLLAQAEVMDSQTQQRKHMFDEQLQIAKLQLAKAELDLAAVKERNRMVESQNKNANEIEKIVTTKGLDAMVEGITKTSDQAHDLRMKAQDIANKDTQTSSD